MTIGARDFIDKLLVEKYAQEKVDNHDEGALVSKVDADEIDFTLLKEKEEVELIKAISKVKEIIKSAANEYEPSIVTRYIIDIASMFSTYYNAHHIIVEDKKLMEARLSLVYAVNVVLKECLALLGISAPEKM